MKWKIRVNLSLANIFLFAALFFSFSSFFGLYERTIYNLDYFLLFWFLELVFWLGLCSGNWTIKNRKKSYIQSATYTFSLSRIGKCCIFILNLLCIMSFLYFLYTYNQIVGFSLNGKFTAEIYQEGRTTFEKISLLIMQLGGDATFLVVSRVDNYKNKYLKALSTICLFLPGLRYLIMGSRYALAVEALIFLIIKSDDIKTKLLKGIKSFKFKIAICIFLVLIFIVFMYLFKTRMIYYTALEKHEFYLGDITLKPFWVNLYYKTNGGIDFLCSFSDYMAEAPFIFSYYCAHGIPEQPFGGILIFRPIVKIFTSFFGIKDIYTLIESKMMSGKYCGAFYSIICDYGIVLAPAMTFLYGVLFSKIEKHKKVNKICATLMPAIMVICFFAPVYFFNVGRLDFTIFFAIMLSFLFMRGNNVVI